MLKRRERCWRVGVVGEREREDKNDVTIPQELFHFDL